MSEEQEEGGMSAVKKAIIGALTTAVTAGGAWFATHLGGKEEFKTEQTAPGAPVVINLSNNNTNQQKQQSGGGTNTIIKERVVEKPAATPAPATKPEPKEEDPW